MTKEEKDLLFKDLCMRLPYHIRCKIWLKDGTTEEGPLDLEHNYADVLLNTFYYNDIKDIKPYLRPMSSMTKEEKQEYTSYVFEQPFLQKDKVANLGSVPMCIDWLNKHHFDYRGLIEKGLAIAVTEENNPYEK
jgi:hypothetical protein